MATITISDVDDVLVEKIRDLAEKHNHSVEKEIRDLLLQSLTRPLALAQGHETLDREMEKELVLGAKEELKLSEMKRRKQQLKDEIAKLQAGDRSFIDIANAIAALTPKGLPQTDSAVLLREDRER